MLLVGFSGVVAIFLWTAISIACTAAPPSLFLQETFFLAAHVYEVLQVASKVIQLYFFFDITDSVLALVNGQMLGFEIAKLVLFYCTVITFLNLF
jgi:hypothetical protein